MSYHPKKAKKTTQGSNPDWDEQGYLLNCYHSQSKDNSVSWLFQDSQGLFLHEIYPGLSLGYNNRGLVWTPGVYRWGTMS